MWVGVCRRRNRAAEEAVGERGGGEGPGAWLVFLFVGLGFGCGLEDHKVQLWRGSVHTNFVCENRKFSQPLL